MKRGSLRELLKKPNWDFATVTLALGLLPASVIGVLRYNDITKPWSTVQFSVVSAYRAFDSAYEDDLSPRLSAASLEDLKTAISNAPSDAMLPGGLVYLADDGLRLQRIDTAKAALLRQENQRFSRRLNEVCGDTLPQSTITSCDPLTLYDLIRSEFDAEAKARVQSTALPYWTFTGEHQHPLRPTEEATPTREFLLLAQQPQRTPVEEAQLRGAQSRVEDLASRFIATQPHEQQYMDELRAYAQRPKGGSLYGTWEYRGTQPIDWTGAHDAGKRKPHLVILADTRGTLIWQFYNGEEHSVYIAPNGKIATRTPR